MARYYVVDKESTAAKPVFNQVTALKDSKPGKPVIGGKPAPTPAPAPAPALAPASGGGGGDAVAAQAEKIKALKASGKGNKDPEVVAAVTVLKELKAAAAR